MSSPSIALQAGLDALKQGDYLKAIEQLEGVCQEEQPNSKVALQAQMYLVKAYQRAGQLQLAIALCRQLTTHEQSQVQQWAVKTLPTLLPPAGVVQEFLQAGHTALKQKRYAEACQLLEQFLQNSAGLDSAKVQQAQMWLVKAYQGNGQLEEAIARCQQLQENDPDPLVQNWVQQLLPTLASAQAKQGSESPAAEPSSTMPMPIFPKAGRAAQMGVKLLMKGTAASLALASVVTISLLFGMVLVLALSLTLIVDSTHPTIGLMVAIGLTIVFTTLVFFLSPMLMDLMQQWLYGTRWISLTDLERHSPESARVVRRICSDRKLRHPKLGLIDDQNPTAFTYGSLPDTARLVVSRGLFTYLDDDEVATVYAHELGHVVHWDFAVMTAASALVQITYLMYVYARELGEQINDKRVRGAAVGTAIAAYVFYFVGTYLLLYLSRTREYFADHFAAETTGNPNGLSRALVKIAYGIVEEGRRNENEKKPNRLMEGTRALGIYDAKAATSTGTAYRVASDPSKVGRVFLWDLFNPWAWWMELQSTHPLTGKRVRALSTYAEQLGLDVEYEMGRVVKEGRTLSKRRLYSSFFLDLLLYSAETTGIVVGALLGLMQFVNTQNPAGFLIFPILGGGIGLLLKTLVMYPSFHRAPYTDVLTLMSDPYASPLRGQPVKLDGTIIGRGDAGYAFGSDLKFQDPTGMMFLRYASLWGPMGNFFFGMTQVSSLIGNQGAAVGWFRRGIMPYLDLFRFNQVNSYHRFWSFLVAGGAIALSFFLMAVFYS